MIEPPRRLAPGRLVIASHNQGKVREIRALLGPYGMEPVSAAELGLPEPEETGTSFAENALLKAHAAAGAGLVALADDSGLCVEALGGAPGVYTANWAETGDGTRDWMQAMEKVEAKLRALGPAVSRAASFVSTLALAWPEGEACCFEGRVAGTLVWPPRGAHGFGYDPMFVPEGSTLSFGEMAPADKKKLSHRTRAFEALVAGVLG